MSGIGQALQQYPEFRYYQTRNEQAMVHASVAYAKTKNRLQTFACLSSIGPGATNMITGAAVATTIGRGIGVCFQLYCLFGPKGRIQVKPVHLGITGAVMKRLIHLSFGGVGQFIIATSSWIVLMKIVSGYGAEAVAGYTVAIRVVMFTFLPAWGMANAAATLVGQNLGARKPDRAVKSVWRAATYNAVFLLFVGIVFTVSRPTSSLT